MRVAVGAFLLAHGLVHAAIWSVPKPKDQSGPFDPGHSWLLGDRRSVAIALASAAAALFIGAGVGVWAHAGWWGPPTVAGSAVSLLLIALFFNAWLTLAVALDIGLIAGVVWLNWPSSTTLGG